MLRRNFISLIPPSFISLLAGGGVATTKQEKLETISKSYTHIYKINNRVICETTETEVDISGRKDITELIAPNATYVNCCGCTKLTKLELPAATTVSCYNCTKLSKLELPAATTVNCCGCTQLTKLELPVATYVYCGGCTSLSRAQFMFFGKKS